MVMAIMATMKLPMVSTTFLFLAPFLLSYLHRTEAQIGVCYGMLGNNLPSREDVVKLYKSNHIGSMRIYSADQVTLKALNGSGIRLILDTSNDKIQSLWSDPTAATEWAQTNVVPYASIIWCIAVGNRVHPSDPLAPMVGPAMQNILDALKAAKLAGDPTFKGRIRVSTAIDMSLITHSYSPSISIFSNTEFMGPIVKFLESNKCPLLVNIYPYYAYISDKKNIDINYTLFTSPEPVVIDNNNGLQYNNLFDSMVDSVYAALRMGGGPNTRVVVSETGWPSGGGDAATEDNAGTYYKNLINHLKLGTALRPGRAVETYLFSMFDENQKTGQPSDLHFGIFNPNQKPKYQLKFG